MNEPFCPKRIDFPHPDERQRRAPSQPKPKREPKLGDGLGPHPGTREQGLKARTTHPDQRQRRAPSQPRPKRERKLGDGLGPHPAQENKG